MNTDQLTAFLSKACDFDSSQLPPALQGVKLTVNIATEIQDISKTISAWITSPQEFVWLGGDQKIASLPQINNWVHSAAIGSFALLNDGEPVAFMNIDSYPAGTSIDQALELGRLVVDPSHRDRRYGTVLLDHLNNCLSSFISSENLSYHIHGRRVRGNNNGKLFLRHSKSLRQSPPYDDIRDDNHAWYDFGSPDIKNIFSSALKFWREEKKMSRAELAQRANISNTMITAYEKGTKLPKLETLLSISKVLAENPLEWAKLITSFFNPNSSELILEAATVGDELDNTHVDMYVFTDTLGEVERSSFLQETKEAILNDFKRYYFIDNPVLERDLLDRFRAIGLTEREIKQTVQIYLAPRILCSFRLALRAGKMRGTQVATLSPGGEDHRVHLTQSMAESLIEKAKTIIAQFESTAPRTEFEGFSQLYPVNSLIKGDENANFRRTGT